MPNHERRLAGRRQGAVANRVFHAAGDARYLLFAVASDVHRAATWRDDERRRSAFKRSLVADFFDARQHPVNAFMQRSGEHRV
ncbi:MAG TPA: hypothetical protein VL280_11525, partial [Burkholderiales bacterium]|nr:hypothetical protein [Burkholderiales bacterium]